MSGVQALDARQQSARTVNEGVTVIGEAVRRVQPEQAEFLVEITATAPTATQALHENHARTAQLKQAITALGVQQTEMQTISLNVMNVYSPVVQALPGYGGIPQLGTAGFQPYGPGAQTDVQFGSYQAKNTVRVSVREAGRVGEILDTATRNGASAVSPFSFRTPDEAGARRGALEAAGRDARAKAEALAAAAGRKIGEAIAISEDIVASNGVYTALRTAFPLSFGAGAPQVAGELEYYARVSASFKFQ
jgi:uncharacterized protein YggE